jgi:predicted ester cyclase
MTATVSETAEGKVAVVRRLLEEGFSAGKLAVCDEVIAEDCLEHQRGNPPGREGHKQVISTLRSWFEDFHIEIEDYSVNGDLVWLRNKATGTNTGSMMGFPATGKRVEITVYDTVRVRDGKIVEHWGVPDQLGLMVQLGLLPTGRSEH